MRPPFATGVSPAYKVSLLQVLVGLVAIGLWSQKSPLAAYSALLGTLIAVIPQLFFAKKVFAKQGARAARQIVNAFYIGETTKWLLTIALFVLVFVKAKPDPLALVVTFAATQLTVPLVTLLVIKRNQG